MADTSVIVNFSSKVEAHNSTGLPPGWLECKRKSDIIAGKYLKIILLRSYNYYLSIEKLIAFKTPLDDRFNANFSDINRWSCGMLIELIKNEKV